MLLVGDIGGTNARLELFDRRDRIKSGHFRNCEFNSFKLLIEHFLGEKMAIQKACFAVAGPVRKGSCQITNLPWILDEKKLSQELDIPSVSLINDLEATAWGIQALGMEAFELLNPGMVGEGHQVVIGVGTGLGEACIFKTSEGYLPFASEGGHVDFAPSNHLEMELWNYLHKKYGHVSYERILSGHGLEHLYWFLVEQGRQQEREIDREHLPRFITEKGISGESQLCQEVIEWFATLYGRFAGNVALQFLATGGIFLGGGISPKIVKVLKRGGFMKAFTNKGRMDALLSQMPVRVILDERAPLLGTLEYLASHILTLG